MRMPVAENPYVSDDTLLFFQEPASDSKPIEFFNDRLHADGRGRPFGVPVRIHDAIHTVPLSGAEPAGQVLRGLESLGLAGQFAREPAYILGTIGVESKAVPHAGLEFAPVVLPADQTPPDFPRPPAGLRRPVVALLDTGVRPHAWLPADHDPQDPFVIHADRLPDPWEPGRITGNVRVHPAADGVPVYGHGTFVAGLIRQGAPTAQVLDVQVMGPNGKGNEGKVCDALCWLLDHYIGAGHPVDVVCMAFGRVPGDASDPALLHKLEGLLGDLAAKGVQLVASAGNDHQQSEIYPAAFETVTAVGAGFGHYRAVFSNFGDWVDRYRDGVDVVSIVPDEDVGGAQPSNRWGRWSGTSFAAANFAADIARPHVR